MKFQMKKILTSITMLLCIYNFTAFAETLTVETVTDALNYSGNRATVTKLVITGQITGSDNTYWNGDYLSEESEWGKFFYLNETFPNIEAVEILTDQDIPDYNWNPTWDPTRDTIRGRGLFYYEFNRSNNSKAANWLKSFSAPNVKTIGNKAFMRCENLINVDFPLVTTIGDATFAGSGLTTVDFPNVITIYGEYGESAFRSCQNLISVNFPLTTTIGEWVFEDCNNLTTIYFPLVETIGRGAFIGCDNLTSVDFPLAKTIGESAFAGCTNLTTLNFPLATTIEYGAFARCYSLISIDFPSVTAIGFGAFWECSLLTSVNFPLLETIGRIAFEHCNNLTTLDFPSVTMIDSAAFRECLLLTSVDFPLAKMRKVCFLGLFFFNFGKFSTC